MQPNQIVEVLLKVGSWAKVTIQANMKVIEALALRALGKK